MFESKTTNASQLLVEFAKEFQQCLSTRDHKRFEELIDKNQSGMEASILLGDQIETTFKSPEKIDRFVGEVLDEKNGSISIYFYVEFDGEFRDAIVEFDLHRKEKSYEVDFLVFKPS